MLLLLPASNCLWLLCMKQFNAMQLPTGQTYEARFGDCYMMAAYAALGLVVLADMLRLRGRLPALRPWVACGSLTAAGSVVGTWAMYAAAARPAVIVFPVSAVTSLLLAAAVSVFVFGERRTPALYTTVGLAVAAIVLVNAGASR